MAALLPVPSVIKVRFGFTIGVDTTTGSHLYVTYGNASPTTAQLNTMALSLATALQTNLLPQMHSSVIHSGITITDLAAANAAVGIWGGANPGTLGGQSLTANTAVLINYSVARRYRGGKPRLYWPGGSAANTTNQQTWAPAFITSFGTAWNSMVTAILNATNVWGSGAAIVNVSYYAGREWKPDHMGNYHRIPTPRAQPLVEPVTAHSINATVGSQRRRVRSV